MASNLPEVLKGLPDFTQAEHPELHDLFKKVTDLEHVEPFLAILKRSRLTPKQVNYLNMPWLDGLYQAYYQVTLATDNSDTVPERNSEQSDDDSKESDPSIDNLAFDLLMLHGDYPETMSYLLRQGLCPRTPLGLYTEGYGEMHDWDPLLEVALRLGKLKTARVLADSGAQIDDSVLIHAYREDQCNPEIFEYLLRKYLTIGKEPLEDLHKMREEIDPGPDEKDLPLEDRTTPAWTGHEETTTHPKTREVRMDYLHVFDAIVGGHHCQALCNPDGQTVTPE